MQKDDSPGAGPRNPRVALASVKYHTEGLQLAQTLFHHVLGTMVCCSEGIFVWTDEEIGNQEPPAKRKTYITAILADQAKNIWVLQDGSDGGYWLTLLCYLNCARSESIHEVKRGASPRICLRFCSKACTMMSKEGTHEMVIFRVVL